MRKEGHFGLALLLLSPAVLLSEAVGVPRQEAAAFALLAALLSPLPDVDLKLRPLVRHRGATHTLLAGAAFGAAAALLARSPPIQLYLFSLAFSATASHLLGDVLTYEPVAPLYPLSRRRLALRLFRSSSRAANWAFLAAGSACYLAALLA